MSFSILKTDSGSRSYHQNIQKSELTGTLLCILDTNKYNRCLQRLWMQGNSLRDSHGKEEMNTILLEGVHRPPAVVLVPPIPQTTRAISLGKKSFNSWSPFLCPHKTLDSPVESLRCWYDSWSPNWTGPLHGLSGSDWHNLLPTEGVSTVCEATNEGTLEGLEEGGIWWKGTCKPEILFGEDTVHALRQSPGVGSGAGHGRAQNELPARSGWEVCRQVLPLLFWGDHPLQILLRRSHGCSLEENHMLVQEQAEC